MSKFRNVFNRSATFKDILTLVGGTGMAQVVTFLGYLVLARIYTPEDMGVLSLVVSLAALGTVVATGRYDQAVMLPRKDTNARLVVATAVTITVIFTIIFTVLGIVGAWALSYRYPTLAPFLWVAALLAGAGALSSTWTQWLSRTRRYRDISMNRFSASVLSVAGQIGLWLVGLGGAFGVVMGRALGVVGACLTLGYRARDSRRPQESPLSPPTDAPSSSPASSPSEAAASSEAASSETAVGPDSAPREPVIEPSESNEAALQSRREVLYRYRKMPFLNGLAALFDAARINGINLLIGAIFSAGPLGQFSLAWQLVQAPLALVNAALAQVYFRQLARTRRGQLFTLVKRVTWRCAALGLLPFAALAILAPYLVPFIFGPQWHLAGYLTQWLCLWLYVNLVTSPISTVFITTETQQVSAIFAFFFMALPLGLLALAGAWHWDISFTIMWLSVLMAAALLVFIALAWQIARRWDQAA